MNKYFKSAVEAFREQFDDNKVSAMSEMDAEIVTEIKEILIKTPTLQEIKDILDDWKCSDDEDIRDALMQWNIDHPKGEGGEIVRRPLSIVIKGKRIPAHDIFGLEPKTRIEHGSYERKHLIIINPTPIEMKKVPMYSNTVIEFDSEQERDRYIEKLDMIRKHDLFDLDLLEE